MNKSVSSCFFSAGGNVWVYLFAHLFTQFIELAEAYLGLTNEKITRTN